MVGVKESVSGTPETPVSESEVWNAVRTDARSDTPAVWAEGMLSENGSVRAGWVRVDDGSAELVFDGWVDRDLFEEVGHSLADDRARFYAGAWDVMYADRWRYAWGSDTAEFQMFGRHGDGVVARKGEVRLQPGGRWSDLFRSPREVAASEVESVRKRTRLDGLVNEVCLDLRGGESLTVARRWNWGPVVDIGYNQLMHEMETSWARRLAADLRDALDHPRA